MSFTPKHLTQGGQMTAYRLRMFGQVNWWILGWVLLLFAVSTAVLFYALTPDDVLLNGFWYWCARLSAGFLPLMSPSAAADWTVSWPCGSAGQICTTRLTLAQMLTDPFMLDINRRLLATLTVCATGCGVFSAAVLVLIIWYVGHIGKKESEDEFISGMTLTGDLKAVNRQLKKAGELSDLQIGGLHMVKRAEVMNFLIHGTIGVGKSTLIRWLLDYIRRRGDRAIIYDSGGTFIETHYDERVDKILNAHDSRCENWVLWRECREVVDYENMTAALMPVEGDSDPFWVSSSRTIFSDAAMQFAARPDRNIETFLRTLLSIDLKSLREFLKNTPSANLVEEKIEKTAISIRSVLTNYAKSLRYLQGLDKEGKPEFSIREWMTDAQYDSSWLFISTTARHREAVRPLISMWLSLATLFLQSMGENEDRRVWFIGDEIAGLQKIPQLNQTLAEGRKFGGCFVLGIQNIPQLVHIYGREMAKAIFDLLNTRAYGRSPSAEVARMVEDELGHQRRREAREQNSFGLDQVRDGISIGRDKVNEPIVDYDLIMRMPNLRFYVRLPGEYPVVKLNLKYRRQKKYHPALTERAFRDNLSPELESLILRNERAAASQGLHFPTGNEILEDGGVPPVPGPVRTHPAGPAAADASSPPGPEKKTAPGAAVPQDPVPAPDSSSVVLPEKTPAAKEPVPVAQKAAQDRVPATVAADALPGNVRQLRPVRRPPVAPAVPEADRGVSPLDRLKRLKSGAAGHAGEDSSPPAGEAPELSVQVEKDDAGRLIVKRAGPQPDEPERREEAGASASDSAVGRMAGEEKNILRHHDEGEEHQAMADSPQPGGYER